MIRKNRIIVNVDELCHKLMSDLVEQGNCNMPALEYLQKVLTPLFLTIHKEQVAKAQRAAQQTIQQIGEKTQQEDEKMPEIEWDRMPLLMGKRDLVRWLPFPYRVIEQWIKEGKIVMHKRIGMRAYALTEEIQKIMPQLYKDLKS